MSIVIPAQASDLTLFTTDLDTNIYTTESIHFEVAPGVDTSWYPLRATSLYLPIDVWWDTNSKSVVIHREDRMCVDQRYNAKRLSGETGIIIVDGVTYCSPEFLSSLVFDISFVKDGQVYCFNGESVQSELIHDNGNQRFRESALASLYMAYLKAPDIYDMITCNLTGGYEYMSQFYSSVPFGAIGFVYPSREKPICYIIGNYSGATLLSLIAHEAYHVEQYRSMGITYEKDADLYEQMVLNIF